VKVFVVQVDNGQEYGDYEVYIDSIFKSYRSASQHLVDKEFIPYAINNHVFFENPEVVGVESQKGWITEFDLLD